MPKQSPVPDEFDQPFWDACNDDRLVLQFCGSCRRFQHPPRPACDRCGSADGWEWKQVSGAGIIYSYAVVYDTPIASLQPDQPYNVAVIDLDEAPEINMLSHLPGTPVDQVPIGAKVALTFEVTPATGQKVPEWHIVSE